MANRAVLGVVVALSSLVLAATASGAVPSDSYSHLYGASLSVTLSGSQAEKVDAREISGGKVTRDAAGTFSMEDVVVKVRVVADGTPAGGGKTAGRGALVNRFKTDLSPRTLGIAIDPVKSPRIGPNVTFKIAADPDVRAWFKKGGARPITVSLLDATTPTVLREYSFSGCEPVSFTVQMLPGGGNAGIVEVDTLTVKTASLQIKSNAVLPRWFASGARATAGVTLLNRDGSSGKTYSFPDAALTKFEVTPLDGNTLDVELVETYTFNVGKASAFF